VLQVLDSTKSPYNRQHPWVATQTAALRIHVQSTAYIFQSQDLFEELDGEEDVRPVLEERFRLVDAMEDIHTEPGVATSFE
jgi:hypothetical protein